MWTLLWLHIIIAWYAVEAFENVSNYETLISRKHGTECFEGQEFESPDYCNQCYCSRGKIVCTTKNCDLNIKGSECYEGQIIKSPDDCNQCYCSGGRIMCTTKNCDLNIKGSECYEGQTIKSPDDCNQCYCSGGRIMCTTKNCDLNIKGSECYEGQTIKSPDDCNQCYCSGGRILCTTKSCDLNIKGSECYEGQTIKSPDDCNQCFCSRGRILCTTKSCDLNIGSECYEGQIIKSPDDCNQCYCSAGSILCTTKSCVNIKDMKCYNGQTIKSPDGCNMCYCSGGKFLCTQKRCKSPSKGTECFEGQDIKSPDGCNQCFCSRGKIMCTTKICEPYSKGKPDSIPNNKKTMIPDQMLVKLQSQAKPEELKLCVHDYNIMVGCNYCVCMGGQLYVCTARKCDESKGIYMKRSKKKTLNAISKSPNCIEGQEFMAYDRCNRCYCGAGQILCTKKKCKRPARCTPGEKIPSPDDCNTCKCNYIGEVVCTAKTCGPAVASNLKGLVCTPNTWYSMSGIKNCKECYCVNGKIAFCYMKLCVEVNEWNPRVLMNAIQTKPGILSDKCRKNDFMKDSCTKCYCDESLTWICKSKDLEHCAKQDRKRKHLSANSPNQDYSKKGPAIYTETIKSPIQDIPSNAFVPEDYYQNKEDHAASSFENEKIDESVIDRHSIYTTTPPNKVHEILVTNLSPLCTSGLHFSQGSNATCHSCLCDNHSLQCWSIKGACRRHKLCGAGKLRKNSQSACSVCYCGADNKSYCATDENCASRFKPARCVAVTCMDHCIQHFANLGICHEDKCVCIP